MENIISNTVESEHFEDLEISYLSQFELFDGEELIKFNIIEVNFDQETITLAVTNRGKISILTFDLRSNHLGYYFEYKPVLPNIYLEQFKEVE